MNGGADEWKEEPPKNEGACDRSTRVKALPLNRTLSSPFFLQFAADRVDGTLVCAAGRKERAVSSKRGLPPRSCKVVVAGDVSYASTDVLVVVVEVVTE